MQPLKNTPASEATYVRQRNKKNEGTIRKVIAVVAVVFIILLIVGAILASHGSPAFLHILMKIIPGVIEGTVILYALRQWWFNPLMAEVQRKIHDRKTQENLKQKSQEIEMIRLLNHQI